MGSIDAQGGGPVEFTEADMGRSSVSGGARSPSTLSPPIELTEFFPSTARDATGAAVERARVQNAAAPNSVLKEVSSKVKTFGSVVGLLCLAPFGLLNIVARLALLVGGIAGGIVTVAAFAAGGIAGGVGGIVAGLLTCVHIYKTDKSFLKHMKKYIADGVKISAELAACKIGVPIAFALYVPCFLSAKLFEGAISMLDNLGAARRTQATLRDIFAVDPLGKQRKAELEHLVLAHLIPYGAELQKGQ